MIDLDIKSTIKNRLWKVNYIIPFAKKYRFDDNGSFRFIEKVLKSYSNIKPVKSKNGTRTVGKDIKLLFKTIDITMPKDNRFVYFIDKSKTIAVPGNVISNFTLAYDKIIHGTFLDLYKEAEGTDDYGNEAKCVFDGINCLVKRIIKSLEDSEIKEEIKKKRIDDFSRILNYRAKHFDEALQRILFFNQLLWQTRHRLNGLGRLDKILYSLYLSDINNKYMTKDDASEMIGDFLRQLSCYSEYKSDALMGDIGQIIILGGLNTDGSYFCNELTFMFLKEQAALKKPDPKTLLRVSDKMPQQLLETAIECLLAKTGSPLFSNDDVVIPALMDFGISVEDAYDYCTSACWEPFIVGKSLDQNNIAVFDFFSAFDELLNNQTEFKTFDELLNKYIEYNNKSFSVFLQNINKIQWSKDPIVSMFTDSCNEKRVDISDGGSIYNNYGITTVALSNVVDSLLNINELVFESKKYSLNDLNKARQSNFKDNKNIYDLLKSTKKYGRDDKQAIYLTDIITAAISEIAKNYRNKYGGTVKFGLSSPGYNMVCKHSPADFSGRKFGDPYNTHISCMNAGYTEVVNFASQINYKNQRFNGNVVDFFLAPQFILNNKEKFVIFMRGAIKVGFFQMQMNLMDSHTLIDAKEHPEKYNGLIVRVWGFSAYFNDLPSDYKDLLIERAIAAEKTA